VCPWTCPEGDL